MYTSKSLFKVSLYEQDRVKSTANIIYLENKYDRDFNLMSFMSCR